LPSKIWQTLGVALQQFGKSTWHLSNFGKIRKKWPPTVWQTNLTKIETWHNSPPTRIYVRADRGCHRRFCVGGRVKKEIKNREGFLM
jgi:hypothetical protein